MINTATPYEPPPAPTFRRETIDAAHYVLIMDSTTHGRTWSVYNRANDAILAFGDVRNGIAGVVFGALPDDTLFLVALIVASV